MTPQEFLQKAERIHAKIQEEIKNKPSLNQNIPTPLKMSLKEAQIRYPNISFDRILYNLDDDNKKLLVFESDVISPYTYNDDWFINTNLHHLHTYGDEIYGIIIIGNLIVDGDIYSDDYDNLLVTGDVVCNYLFSWKGYLEVLGNLTAYQGIYAMGDYGEIKVNGKTKTPYAVNNRDSSYSYTGDKFSSMPYIYEEECLIIWADGDDIYLGTLNGNEFQSDFDVKKMFRSSKIYIYDNLYYQEYFQEEIFFEMVKNGENPFLTWQEFEKTL